MVFPAPTTDSIHSRIEGHLPITGDSASTVYYRCHTDCMVLNGIPRGSILAVDFSETPVNGQIVVAKVRGAFIVRLLQKNDYTTKLLANDKRVPDILLNKDMEVVGVVKSMIIQFR